MEGVGSILFFSINFMHVRESPVRHHSASLCLSDFGFEVRLHLTRFRVCSWTTKVTIVFLMGCYRQDLPIREHGSDVSNVLDLD
jgi:hypothetical protein